MASQGPEILWKELKGKRVKANDGQELGEIKEVSENYLQLVKGTTHEDSFWIPKYVVDAYDGKVLWLLVSSDDFKSYAYSAEPEPEQYARGFESFKTTPYGQKAVYPADFNQHVRLTEERGTRTSVT
jgi:hypothetical protein